MSKVGFDEACERNAAERIEKAEKPGYQAPPVAVLNIRGRPSHAQLFAFALSIARLKKDGEQGVEMSSDDAVEKVNVLIQESRELLGMQTPWPSFGYYVNLNERGYFEADVRGQDGKTVFEIKSGLSLPRGESDLIEDGFMKHGADIKGLCEHLKNIKVIPQDAVLMTAERFDELF